MLNFFRRAKKPAGDSIRDVLKDTYLRFHRLLVENNQALELMADLEGKLSGEFLFDGTYVKDTAALISEKVKIIIDNLNAISGGRHKNLYPLYEGIKAEVEKGLSSGFKIPLTGPVIPIERLRASMTAASGGKMANLGEVRGLGLLTPEGFSVTAYAFKKFMEHGGLTEKINDRLSALDLKDLQELNAASKEIQALVSGAQLPPELSEAIAGAVDFLRAEAFSVRSSAVREDGELSFAGQYGTVLNLSKDRIAQGYKDVVSSLFTPRAIFYQRAKGISEDEMVMAVGVLEMVRARAAGVIYSRDPNDPENDTVIINALWGLGVSVVEGSATPDTYAALRETGAVFTKRIEDKPKMVVCDEGGGLKEVAVPEADRRRQCLTDAQIAELVVYAAALEAHYGRPQDIEWALDGQGRIYILQCRPLRVLRPAPAAPRRVEGRKALLERGVVACKGIGYGRAFVLKDEEGLRDFPDGAVLVARHTSTKFVTVMNRAAAIITDIGGATGHMASLSREFGIPTIVDARTATALIKNGQELTVDAVNCNVYEGKVEELLKLASKRRDSFRDTRLFATLERISRLIVPLTLIDPDADNFRAEHCKTYHDITRFAHETAMAEVFKTGKGEDVESFEGLMSAIAFAEAGEAKRLGSQTSALRAGIPIDAHLLDIDGGLNKRQRKITPQDIASIPFSAFLRGMLAMRWPEPRGADVKGFLGMIAHTASIPEEELRKTGDKSYAIVSLNYMNFSIRLGYHFSMVEAFAGENLNDNYIKFFFKGGGAATDRRLRRVRLIKEIIGALGFRVKITGDVLDAIATKYEREDIEGMLDVMGRLTAYTKQLDMALFNDSITDWYIEEFMKEHMKAGRRPPMA